MDSNYMIYLIAIWGFIPSPYFLSLVAIIFSSYTLWDNKFRFKLEVAVGRQLKLFVAKTDNVKPCIFMSLALSNYGGKTGYLNDVKLKVKLKSNNDIIFDEEFISLREYDTLLGDGKSIKQTEILPTVIIGKTTELKKYVFVSKNAINQDIVPTSFDLDIVVFVKEGGKWKSQKVYEVKSIAGIWKDFTAESNWKMIEKDVIEKN